MSEQCEIIHADCMDAMKAMAADSIDAVVTDPPYHLTQLSRGGSPRSAITDRGFMGTTWDGGDVAFRPELWAEVLRVLKPGGHLLAFGGTRTSHRMVCAIEDAGFEIRDSVAWIYAQGFPKSRNMPADGPHAGWGTALKPSIEPICMARKPVEGKYTIEANMAKWGVGALNIDASRIEFASVEDAKSAFPGGKLTSHGKGSLAGPGAAQDTDRSGFASERNSKGRWPANAAFDERMAAVLDEQSGITQPKAPYALQRGASAGAQAVGYGGSSRDVHETFVETDDAPGGASRFFYVAKPDKTERETGLDHLDEKVVSDHEDRSDVLDNAYLRGGTPRKNTHPTIKPVSLMRQLIRLVTPKGGIVLDPFAGSGTTGVAALAEGNRCVLIEKEAEYVEIVRARLRHASCAVGLFAED